MMSSKHTSNNTSSHVWQAASSKLHHTALASDALRRCRSVYSSACALPHMCIPVLYHRAPAGAAYCRQTWSGTLTLRAAVSTWALCEQPRLHT